MNEACEPPPEGDGGAFGDDAGLFEATAEAGFVDAERRERLWLRACCAFVESSRRPGSGDVASGRVRLAIDDAVIAACERAARIFRSDLPPTGWDLERDEPESR